MSSQRPPRSLSELRESSREQLANISPDEYSIRTWISTAKVAFETAERHWREGSHEGRHDKVEEAYLDFKKAAGIMHIITKHHRYAGMQAERQGDHVAFFELQAMLKDAALVNKKVVSWLEEADARLAASSAKSQTSAQRAPPVDTRARQDSVSDLIDGYGSPTRPPTSPPKNSLPPTRPPPITTPSGGQVQTVAERLANLRANGATGMTSFQVANRTTSAVPAPSHSTSTKFRANGTDSSATQIPPAKPPKPVGLSTGRTPPTSPRSTTTELAGESFSERTGSAPPILGQKNGYSATSTENRDTSDLSARLRNLRPSANANVAANVPSASSTYSVDDEPPSPNRFPSLDDFEKQVGSSSAHSSVSASPFFTSTRLDGAGMPASTGKGALLDKETFEREQRERAEQIARLSASLNGQTSSPATSVEPPISTPGPAVQSPRPPPTASSSRSFQIPHSLEVRPLDFFSYLKTSQAESGSGPRVLILDVRTREEYDAGRIRGETVCLEPIILRDGVSSTQIEDALSLSPSYESSLFSARQFYDLVVVYDRSSIALPQAPPTDTTSSAQRALYNLITAIYEREFTKSLKRQPMLLRGGWDAWERHVGAAGSAGTAVQARLATSGDPSDLSSTDVTAKKAENRRAAVLPGRNGSDPSSIQNGFGSSVPSSIPYHAPAARQFTSSSSNYPQSFSKGNGVLASGVVSPRLAMPPVAAQLQRNGSIPEYDPFVPLSSASSHPQSPYKSFGAAYSDGALSPTPIARTRSDLQDSGTYPTSGSMDYSKTSLDYARPSIDYPQIGPRGTPPAGQPLRPHRPAPPPPVPAPHSLVPSVPLTRPPIAKPAPMRSNSSFSSMHIPSYSSAHSQFPTSMNFDDNSLGLTGLKNLGNTCYMNSTIQCLSAAIPFARYFTNGAYRKDINEYNPLGTKGALANAVGELIRALWAQEYSYLAPVTFREAISRVAPQFRSSDQQDAQEFLGFLLDGLHEDCNYVLKKPPAIEMTPEREHDLETLPPQVMSEREWQIYKMRNDSFIVQCFQGQFRNQLRCLTCHKTSTTYNTFMPLSVPIPTHRGLHRVTLMSCLEAFVKDEILDQDDAWHCPRCKKNRKAVKKLSLSKLPPILVIHLKRFSFQGPFSNKIETQVHYPLTGLDLTPFIPPPLMDQKSGSHGSSRRFEYDLFGVTNHYGNLSSGHYTAFIRNRRDWYNIGDSKVSPCDPNLVQSAKSAYILYYALR
ncbi:uncharacterized protein JCM15063_003931 [Sporobolomyces koalae]|uniref:uncharacterized protein n=1 Tax=Sporobolomyces koalae TaxID=500713 RepID=UPI00316CF2B1